MSAVIIRLDDARSNLGMQRYREAIVRCIAPRPPDDLGLGGVQPSTTTSAAMNSKGIRRYHYHAKNKQPMHHRDLLPSSSPLPVAIH